MNLISNFQEAFEKYEQESYESLTGEISKQEDEAFRVRCLTYFLITIFLQFSPFISGCFPVVFIQDLQEKQIEITLGSSVCCLLNLFQMQFFYKT